MFGLQPQMPFIIILIAVGKSCDSFLLFCYFCFGVFWFAKSLIFVSSFLLNITSYVFVLPGYVCVWCFPLNSRKHSGIFISVSPFSSCKLKSVSDCWLSWRSNSNTILHCDPSAFWPFPLFMERTPILQLSIWPLYASYNVSFLLLGFNNVPLTPQHCNW